MTIPRSFLDYPWRWQMFGGRQTLVTDGGGAMVVLTAEHHAYLQVRDPETGLLRAVHETDQAARIIAAAPEVRRHARALLNGINLGFLEVSDEAEPSFRVIVASLREALEKSGGA